MGGFFSFFVARNGKGKLLILSGYALTPKKISVIIYLYIIIFFSFRVIKNENKVLTCL